MRRMPRTVPWGGGGREECRQLSKEEESGEKTGPLERQQENRAGRGMQGEETSKKE